MLLIFFFHKWMSKICDGFWNRRFVTSRAARITVSRSVLFMGVIKRSMACFTPCSVYGCN